MDGLQRLVLRITPIITLVCFICLGIIHTFPTSNPQETQNITYITQENITINDNNTETTSDDLTLTYYDLDIHSYLNGIKENRLKTAVSSTIDIKTYQDNLDVFNLIWNNGYNFGDGIKTLVNGILLVINTMIFSMNMALLFPKLIMALIMTGLSVVGINTTSNRPLLKTYDYVINFIKFPLIPPTYNRDAAQSMLNSTWLFNEKIITFEDTPINMIDYWDFDFNFTSQAGGNYKKLLGTIENDIPVVRYVDQNNNSIVVYTETQGWIYQDSKTITISDTNEFDATSNDFKIFLGFFQINATQLT